MSESWTSRKILETSGSYWQTFALHAAVKLDIFTLPGKEKFNAKEIAQKCESDPRGMEILLDALCGMRLLEKHDGFYQNTEEAKTYLSKDSPQYLGYMIQHHAQLVEGWNKLDKAVKTGMPTRIHSHSKEERENFLMGMFNLAMMIAPGLARQIPLSDRKKLLDLGGGPGTYCIQFCLANPQLYGTIYDLPGSREFAQKTIEQFGLSQRVRFIGGDYLKDVIPGSYDVAWLSHIFHAEGEEGCKAILEKAVNALSPGGLILIHDFFLDSSKTQPLFASLFSLNMLVNTKEGRSYSEEEIREKMKNVGIVEIQRLDFIGPNQSGILYGKKI